MGVIGASASSRDSSQASLDNSLASSCELSLEYFVQKLWVQRVVSVPPAKLRTTMKSCSEV